MSPFYWFILWLQISLVDKVIIDDDEFRSLFDAKKSSFKKVDQGAAQLNYCGEFT